MKKFLEEPQYASWKIFWPRGGSLVAREGLRHNALHYAVLGNNLDVVRALLDHGMGVNAEQAGGLTPLHLAVNGRGTADNYAVARLLLDRGADPHKESASGNTTLHYVFECGSGSSFKAVVALMEGGADMTLKKPLR